MTPIAALTLSLYLAAAASAVALARRDRRHRPVAVYLTAVVALDGLRWLRALLLPPAQGIREGWELWLRHAEAGLYLASILALPVVAVVVLRPMARRWPIAAAWLALWLVVVAGYPELRSGALLELYGAVEVVSAGAVVALWWPHRRERSPTLRCLEALAAGALATALLPWLSRHSDALAGWGDVVATNALAVGVVLAIQAHATTPRRGRAVG
jgi:hypothetical protein